MTIKGLLKMGFPKTSAVKQLQIANPKTKQEFYIDNRTEADSEFNYKVHPITANRFFYAIVCPNCQKIHLFPNGYSSQNKDGFEDHVFVPETLVLDESGKYFQITVIDNQGLTDMDKETEDFLWGDLYRMVVGSENPKMREAFESLFDDAALNFGETIDPDAADANING